MTYEEKIEAMAEAMYEAMYEGDPRVPLWANAQGFHVGRFRSQARAAAEGIGLREMMEALAQSQKALAMMTEPASIQSNSVANAWAAAVAAECAARRALSPARDYSGERG